MKHQRKAFNFFGSYYDVFKELPKEEKLPFIEALLDRQFTGKHPDGLSGMAKFAYISQKHSIDKQVKGYEDKTGIKLTSTPPPSVGEVNTPRQQVQVQEKEKGKEDNNVPSVKKPKSPIDFVKLLAFINTTQKREGKDKFKVINKSVQGKYKARIKDGYTSEQIANSIINSAEDNYHKETNYKYLTPEFFSRSQTIDKHGFKTKAQSSSISKDDFQSNNYS